MVASLSLQSPWASVKPSPSLSNRFGHSPQTKARITIWYWIINDVYSLETLPHWLDTSIVNITEPFAISVVPVV